MNERLLQLQHDMAEARSRGQHRRAFRKYKTWKQEWEALGRPEDASWQFQEVQEVVRQVYQNGESEELQIVKRLRLSVKGNFYLEVAEEEQAKQKEHEYKTWWQTWVFRRHEIDSLSSEVALTKSTRRALLVAGISTRKEFELFQRYTLLSKVLNIDLAHMYRSQQQANIRR